jgi:hypothetical protein
MTYGDVVNRGRFGDRATAAAAAAAAAAATLTAAAAAAACTALAGRPVEDLAQRAAPMLTVEDCAGLGDADAGGRRRVVLEVEDADAWTLSPIRTTMCVHIHVAVNIQALREESKKARD